MVVFCNKNVFLDQIANESDFNSGYYHANGLPINDIGAKNLSMFTNNVTTCVDY